MFIASLICLILGIVLLIVAAVLFFKLDVLEAWRFMNNKRRGRSNASYSNTRARKRHNMSSNKKKNKTSSSPAGSQKQSKLADDLKSNIDNVVPDDSAVKSKKGSDIPTYVLDEDDSESQTGILAEESESPTGLLQDDSESPTGLLEDDDSEKPTGLLDEDVITKKQEQSDKNQPQSDFRFEIVKDIVVVHTDETIT